MNFVESVQEVSLVKIDISQLTLCDCDVTAILLTTEPLDCEDYWSNKVKNQPVKYSWVKSILLAVPAYKQRIQNGPRENYFYFWAGTELGLTDWLGKRNWSANMKWARNLPVKQEKNSPGWLDWNVINITSLTRSRAVPQVSLQANFYIL